jgi:DNA-directed RNA polymerase subunit alpha
MTKNSYLKVLKSEKLDTGSWYGQILISGLKSGFTAVGQQLRAIMLSEIKGLAISAIRINGTKHEFTNLSDLGVREDLLEIILNVKSVILKSETNDTKYGRIKVQGPAVITADFIDLPSGIEIVNPNHYIATISKPTNFEIEFKLEHGKGYKISNSRIHSHEIDPIKEEKDFIYIDSVFMPIRKVNFKVEKVFDNKDHSCERLFLEIWTDGSLDPLDAYRNSCKILIKIYDDLLTAKTVYKINKTIEKPLNTKQLTIEQYKDISIEVLDLSIRPYNCLKKANINTIGKLLKYSINQLLELRNFGQKSANEVFSKLKNKYNIILK